MACILIVDDDAPTRALLRAVLVKAGHVVREAAGGEEALRVLGLLAVDLLVCDLYMPGKDGLETLREAGERFPAVPVVAISGGGWDGLIDLLPAARKLGAVQVLHKPFTRQALTAAVARALQAHAGNPAG